MRVTLKQGAVVLVPDTDAERAAFASWRADAAGHVFRFNGGTEAGGALLDLGPREHACREPINIMFGDSAPQWQPISNLALTPFTLRGQPYASVEGFWQGLKFTDEQDRARVARFWGIEAKRAAQGLPECPSFTYDGQVYAVGGAGHHGLMLQACRAKFVQDLAAREALLLTGERPLTHRARRDSKTIPGALMAEIWMRVRAMLRGQEPSPDQGSDARMV